MAQLDITDILNDPMFVDAVTLIVRVPRVNGLGENVVTETCIQSYGTVQPISGRTLQRLPDELRVANVSSFWFKGEIVASDNKQYPSILVFGGKRFQVQMVFDWLNWGGGWCEGVCIAEKPA